jgi:VanZ family protein
MKKLLSIVPRWFPAVFMMIAIFTFSSTPGGDLPTFFDWDYIVKKAGHMIGYGLLALSYFHYLNYEKKHYRLAWFLAILFSITDELHQWVVPERHASVFDTIIFDNFGAIIALWLHFKYWRVDEKKAPP